MTGKKNQNGRKPGENQQNSPKSSFSSEWIASEDLLKVFAGLLIQRRVQNGPIDGSMLGWALQRLLRAETAPGGPYINSGGAVDPLANAAIALFLREEGVRLPALEAFVAQFEPQDLERQLRAAAPRVTAVSRVKLHELAANHEALLANINIQVRADITAWPDPLAATGERLFTKLLRADKTGEIRLMPQLFVSSLTISSKTNSDQLILLGAANVFFWIGGMLFDDFLDGEGRPELLPIATVAHRRALTLYRQVTAGAPEFSRLVEVLCLRADRANAWEVTQTRARVARGVIALPELPDYGDYWALADRSIGHMFGPLLIMRRLPGVTDAQRAQVEQGLRHYLIARQLNDDIHDWRQDLETGQLSAVVVELLRSTGVRPGSRRLTTLLPKIERYVMHEGLPHVYDLLHEHVVLARQSLTASGLIEPDSGLENLIARQESVMRAALKIHANHQQFLATFTDGQ